MLTLEGFDNQTCPLLRYGASTALCVWVREMCSLRRTGRSGAPMVFLFSHRFSQSIPLYLVCILYLVFWFFSDFLYILYLFWIKWCTNGLLTFPQMHLVTIFRITEWTFVFHVCSNLQSLFVSVAKFSGVCGSYQLPRSSLTWKWVHYSDKGACMHSCGANKKLEK